MPNKISLEEVSRRLPPFVKIVPETYKGVRYKAKFIDTEYGEEFEAIVHSVISLQYGCPARANERRSQNGWKKGPRKIPIEEIKSRLPAYIQIDESTYKGIRGNASFIDTKYNYKFEGLVCNVLRHGKAYGCPERRLKAFREKIMVKIEDIQKRIDLIYGKGELRLIPESYKGTNCVVQFERRDGRKFKANMSNALSGKLEKWRYLLQDWAGYIRIAFNYTCGICGANEGVFGHHIFAWKVYPQWRFEKRNGYCLCEKCHNEYHSKNGKGSTLESFNLWLASKGVPPVADFRTQANPLPFGKGPPRFQT